MSWLNDSSTALAPTQGETEILNSLVHSFAIIDTILFFLALFNNGVILMVTFVYIRSNMSLFHIEVSNLVVADFLNGLACSIIFPIKLSLKTDFIAQWACSLEAFLQILFAGGSVLTCAVMAVERHLIVVNGIKLTKPQLLFIHACTWMFMISVVVPPLFNVNYFMPIPGGFYCALNWYEPGIALIPTFGCIGLVGGGLIVILVCYTRVFRRFSQLLAKTSLDASEQIKSQRTVALRSFSLFCFICICWLPYGLFMVGSLATGEQYGGDFFRVFAPTMVFFNTAMNPVLYGVMERRYRDGVVALLTCGRVTPIRPDAPSTYSEKAAQYLDKAKNSMNRTVHSSSITPEGRVSLSASQQKGNRTNSYTIKPTNDLPSPNSTTARRISEVPLISVSNDVAVSGQPITSDHVSRGSSVGCSSSSHTHNSPPSSPLIPCTTQSTAQQATNNLNPEINDARVSVSRISIGAQLFTASAKSPVSSHHHQYSGSVYPSAHSSSSSPSSSSAAVNANTASICHHSPITQPILVEVRPSIKIQQNQQQQQQQQQHLQQQQQWKQQAAKQLYVAYPPQQQEEE